MLRRAKLAAPLLASPAWGLRGGLAMLRRLRIAAALLALPLLGLGDCEETVRLEDLSFVGVHFSPRVRPDLVQLVDYQQLHACSGPPPCTYRNGVRQPHPIDTHFDDGGPNGDRLVSPLIPQGVPVGPLEAAQPRGNYRFPLAPV